MYGLTQFGLKEMAECGSALRHLGVGASSMEEAANRAVRYLFDHLIDPQTGTKACALVRLFKTHRFDMLDPKLQRFAQTILGQPPEPPEMKCLTLMATCGIQTEWNGREGSRGHQAIPLSSHEMVLQVPMISNLIRQFGLEIGTVLNPDPTLLLDLAEKTYNVFHVPHAEGSPFIPAQKEFVIPFGVRSVLGFGGMLPEGDLFAVILFSRVFIPNETAELFRTMALNIKSLLFPFEGTVFASSSGGI